MSPSRALGVDGIRGGWVAASSARGEPVRWHLAPTVEPLLEQRRREQTVMAIDIPIGLSTHGARTCDRAARARLSRSRSSVFPAPTAGALADWRNGHDHATAVRRCRERGEPAPSRQAWHLLGKIAEVDTLVTAPLQGHVVECHPEVCFAVMDPRVTGAKRSAAGIAQRLRALRGWVDAVDALAHLPAGVPLVDAIDALACLWTAHRVAAGRAEPLGDPSQRDAAGRRMLIWV